MRFFRSDQDFILAQIKLAEANADGADMLSLLPNVQVPRGLRTVTGIGNNLLAGQCQLGAADDIDLGAMVTWKVVKAQARDRLGISLTNAVRTGHKFLIDIAHNAAPVFNALGQLAPDADLKPVWDRPLIGIRLSRSH